MSVTRQERERVVLDLYYNQGKTVRDIAKEARMSFRDIGSILNKADEAQRKYTIDTTDNSIAFKIQVES
jgi:DNA-directed RNA polymerase specialized sigma subunit